MCQESGKYCSDWQILPCFTTEHKRYLELLDSFPRITLLMVGCECHYTYFRRVQNWNLLTSWTHQSLQKFKEAAVDSMITDPVLNFTKFMLVAYDDTTPKTTIHDLHNHAAVLTIRCNCKQKVCAKNACTVSLRKL